MKKLLFLFIFLSLTFNLCAQEIIADLIITDKDGKTVQSDIGLAVLNEELRGTLKTMDIGTGPGDILTIDSNSKIPAFTGSQVTNVNSITVDGYDTSTTAGASKIYVSGGDNYLPDATVDTTALKTATGEVSVAAGVGSNLTLPGGTYGFYPQVKGATAGSDAIVYIFRNGVETMSATYTTIIGLYNTSYICYAQQRYVTASGEDMWIFLLIDKTTKEIVSAYQASDHCSYGNTKNGNPNELPHPFSGYNSDTQEIIILDKDTCNMLKKESEETGESILTIVNEKKKVDCDIVKEYVPLHSGKYLIENKEGKQIQIRQMVETIPSYIKVKGLKDLSDSDIKERKQKQEQQKLLQEQDKVKKEQDKQGAINKLIELGLTKEQVEALR